MSSSLDLLLANVIITELDHKIIKCLINENTIKFFGTYIDDVIKRQYVRHIFPLLSSFDKNLHFTVNLFQNEVPHFLNLQISPDGASTFRKNTNTVSYTYYKSYIPWNPRTAWIQSFASHTSRIWCPYKLPSETMYDKKVAIWNGFPIPKPIVKPIINQALNLLNKNSPVHNN